MKVPFYDLDPLNIVWHGNYLKYFDIARQELFSRSGLDLMAYCQEKQYIFPVIRSSVKHVHPLRYGDDFICTAVLREASVKIVLDFEVRLVEKDKLCATGRSEQCALYVPQMEMDFVIPQEVQEALWSIR
jgi:acyl-CoA thioester hydrolase